MIYNDQQIADLAHKLEAKGAPMSDIETFVKGAKAEQKQSRANPNVTPATAMPNAPQPSTNPLGGVGDAINNFGKGVSDTVKGFGKNTLDAAEAGASQAVGGIKELGSNIVNPSQNTGGKALSDIAEGTLGAAFSPVSGAINSLPEGDVKDAVNTVTGAPHAGVEWLAKGAGHVLGVNTEDPSFHDQVVKPLQAALDIFMTKSAPKAAGVAGDIAGKVPEVAAKVGDLASEGVSKAKEMVNPPINVDKVIDKGIEKGIRPSVSGKKTAAQVEDYKTSGRDAVKTIIQNKPHLNLTDLKTGETRAGSLPENLHQFGEAIEQTKSKVFQEYDALTKQTGEAGVKVNTKPISEELLKVADDKVLKDTNPGVAKYAKQKAAIYNKRGAYTPEEAQQAIKAYNDGLQAFYRNPTYDSFAKVNIDALVANKLRSGLDEAVTGLTGEQYQSLKNKYGSLKAIEKDVNHRAIVDARKNTVGLGEGLANVASAAEALHAISALNPASLASSAAIKGLSTWIKHLNDPNVVVKNMFKKTEKGILKGGK